MTTKTKTAKNEAILNGGILNTLLIFAVPIICGNIFQQLYNVVDAMVVGKLLGDLPLAGISAAAPIMDILYGIITGSTVGIGVLIGQLCGGGEWERLKKAHATAIIGGVAFALLLMLICLFGAGPVLLAQGTDPVVEKEAVRYLTVIAAGLVFNFLYCYFAAALRSYGDSRTPFIVLAVSSVLHAGLDFFLVGVLNMGILGVASSTVFSQFFSTLCLGLYIEKKCPALALSRKEMHFDKASALSVLSYAWAAAMQQIVVQVGRFLIQGMLNQLGTDTVTGYNLGMRTESFLQCVSQGVSGSAVVCMAQNYGHKNADRLRKFYYTALKTETCVGLLMGVVCSLFARQFIGIFSDNASVIEAGSSYTFTMAWIYIFSCYGEIMQGFFRGVGRLKVTMIASALQVLLRVILSSILIPRLGIPGICYSVATGWVLLTLVEGAFSLREAKKIRFT